MYQSIPAVPIPPGPPLGFWFIANSHGKGYCKNSTTARGWGHGSDSSMQSPTRLDMNCLPKFSLAKFNASNFWVLNSVQVLMASLITEFAGKSPDFEKGWLEKVSLYKLIPIFVGKSRYIFILVILYVKNIQC